MPPQFQTEHLLDLRSLVQADDGSLMRAVQQIRIRLVTHYLTLLDENRVKQIQL